MHFLSFEDLLHYTQKYFPIQHLYHIRQPYFGLYPQDTLIMIYHKYHAVQDLYFSLYPCHQFVGDEKFRLGDIWNGIENKEILNQFNECNVYSHKECKDCFAKLYCSGGCAANAYHTTGSVNGVYEFGCELHRKRIECAIMLKVAEAEENLNVTY